MNVLKLIKEIEGFELINRLYILKYLMEQNIKIHEGLDGSRINLSKLNDKEIENLEQFVKNLKSVNVLQPKFQIE